MAIPNRRRRCSKRAWVCSGRSATAQNIAIGLMHSALAALARGDHGRVRVLCEEGLGLLRKAGDRQHIADCLEIMAGAPEPGHGAKGGAAVGSGRGAA